MKVIIVDDSAVYRQFLRRSLEGHQDIKILGHAANGKDAIERIEAYKPNVVIMDMNMPVMNGLEALKIINKRFPEIKVLIVSSETPSDADLALQLLDAGAFDVILKPKASDDSQAFIQDLLEKVRATRAQRRAETKTGSTPVISLKPKPATSSFDADIIAIGSSTGGPAALHQFIDMLPASMPVPIVIVQHMPKLFLESLVKRLDTQVPFTCGLAKHGQTLLPGHIYIAPGEQHLDIKKMGPDLKAFLHDGPAEHHCKPAVDVTFRSLAALAPRTKTLAIVLTGMGSDGALGAQAISDKGGYVIAQDQATSVVWGMPGATVRLGAAQDVLPLNAIAPALLNLIEQRMPA